MLNQRVDSLLLGVGICMKVNDLCLVETWDGGVLGVYKITKSSRHYLHVGDMKFYRSDGRCADGWHKICALDADAVNRWRVQLAVNDELQRFMSQFNKCHSSLI